MRQQDQENAMSNENLTIAFTVEQSPEEAFAAIASVRDWWSGDIDGSTDQLGAVFTYRYQDVHRSTQRITELVPARRIAWHIEDSYLSFVGDKTEWNGTDVIFEVTPTDAGTEVRFTHEGLAPAVECFDSCSTAWEFYIGGSLRNLITKSQGQPNPREA
jgi:Activator of Hsp90 ATPase homolog 1-like protein